MILADRIGRQKSKHARRPSTVKRPGARRLREVLEQLLACPCCPTGSHPCATACHFPRWAAGSVFLHRWSLSHSPQIASWNSSPDCQRKSNLERYFCNDSQPGECDTSSLQVSSAWALLQFLPGKRRT